MGGNLPPQLAAARAAVRAAVAAWWGREQDQDDDAATPHLLVACSGGADSLALAATCAWLAGKGHFRAGAVVVDHGLQAGSTDVAERAAEQARSLGLEPVDVVRVSVPAPGTEEQARQARYAALEAVAERWGEGGAPVAILTAHTLSDQAEQVLLGLARGSGTRSLSGIPAARGRILRPFLGVVGAAGGLWRADTEAICAHEGLDPWHDPTNAERDALRNRVRLDVLPHLERELGPGVAEGLARTAALAAADAEFVEAAAGEALERVRLAPAPPGGGDAGGRDVVVLDLLAVRTLPAALRARVLRAAALEAGGEAPTFERVAALERLAAGQGSAGPVQLAGHVQAYRVRRARRALVFRRA